MDLPLIYSRIKGNIAPMSSGNILRIINKYADQNWLDCPELPERVHPHMFRRTRATGLYRSGVELEMISVILGHSSTQTTRIYAAPSVEMIREPCQQPRQTARKNQPNGKLMKPNWLGFAGYDKYYPHLFRKKL